MSGPGKGSKSPISDAIPHDRRPPSSESTSTHFLAREECVEPCHGDAGATFLDPDLQCQGCPSKAHLSHEASSRLGVDTTRTTSHFSASTSPRCSFKWVHGLLQARLTKWMKDDAQDFQLPSNEVLNDPEPVWRYTYVPKTHIRHIIGRGGRVLRQLESFFGTFILISDLASDSKEGEVGIIGPRRACLWTEFAVELIVGGHHSILESLAHHGF